nr:EOG090X0ECZ [Leptodora kindtii]
MSTKYRPSDGDWTCPDASCANINFARRDACNRCGKPKEEEKPKVKKLGVEIGKDAAEKSKGLFSADDWMCSKCGNVNWARRSTCNVCNAPKFGDVEERTGYGGGYNERGNVEYIEREDSDDEFDEFGRRKKKYRGSTSTAPNEIPHSSKKVIDAGDEEEDDDEEDDDDDDGDLSKYDLSGWGEEEPKSKADSAVDSQASRSNTTRDRRQRDESSK